MKSQPHYDKTFGKLCRYLMAAGLTMHTPRKGDPYVLIKTGRPHPSIRPSKEMRG